MTGVGIELLGVSHHTAPLALRERLALDEAGVRAALAGAGASLPGGEALILSTCNRTELYVAGAAGDAVAAWHRGVLGAVGVDAECPALRASRFHLAGTDAARHLFRVACGLESAVLGDNEIVGQIRAAARLADEAGTLGPRLRLVVDHALRTSKQARAETTIGAGGAGIGSAVAHLVAGQAGTRPRVVLVGAGDAAMVIARELVKRSTPQLTVVNRSFDRARDLAARHGGVAAALASLPVVLVDADVVVMATGAHAPLLDPEVVGMVRAAHPGWAPLVIDAGVPRNVDPRCDVAVTTLDSLAERTRRVEQLRARARADVEQRIHAGLARWRDAVARRVLSHPEPRSLAALAAS